MAKGKNKIQPIPLAPAQSPRDTTWDELRQVASDTAKLMGDSISVIQTLASNRTLNEGLKDPKDVAQKIASIGRDMTDYTAQHRALTQRHKDRTGSARSPDDFVEALQLAAEYDELVTSFNNVVLPVVADITLAYGEVQESLLTPPADDADDVAPSTSV